MGFDNGIAFIILEYMVLVQVESLHHSRSPQKIIIV